MTGTQNHEGIAGAAAAVEYLAALDHNVSAAGSGDDVSDDNSRSAQLDRVFGRIDEYERSLSRRMIEQFTRIPGVQVLGITDSDRLTDRVPTISITVDQRTPQELAARLAERGIFVWSGNHYALPFTEAAGLEPNGTLRIGALHYNTTGEVDRVAEALEEIVAGSV